MVDDPAFAAMAHFVGRHHGAAARTSAVLYPNESGQSGTPRESNADSRAPDLASQVMHGVVLATRPPDSRLCVLPPLSLEGGDRCRLHRMRDTVGDSIRTV